ncbi:hypothetical protein PBRA_007539, partial [Plasmodiophora brassicae]
PVPADAAAPAAPGASLATPDDKLQRTIYIGNLDPAALTEHVLAFVAPIGGAVLNVKMCPSGGLTTAHAFVEFGAVAHAQAALGLSGKELFGRSVKVGMAENPIGPTAGAAATTDDVRRKELALEKVREAQERLERKKKQEGQAPEVKRDSRSRSASRSPSRSRSSRHRRHRHRHRSRSPRGRRHRRRSSRSRTPSRSRSRSRSASRSRGGRDQTYARPTTKRKVNVQPPNMVWDGFQWVPRADAPPILINATVAPGNVSANSSAPRPAP